jgi:hypothetical protein
MSLSIISRNKAPSVSGNEPPFERKFVTTEAQAAEVVEWAARHLRPDPHAAPGSEGRYRVTSLYLDTADFDVYHRRGSYGRAKYRVRRYDAAVGVFLERKCKVEGRVRKRRTLVEPDGLIRLGGGPPSLDWAGRWFGRRVSARGLAPTCLVSYERVALLGDSPLGPIRLTVDRGFLCRSASGFEPPAVSSGVVVFAGQGVVELKFRTAMPALFKTLIREHGLILARASKYRTAVEACGLCAGTREGADV